MKKSFKIIMIILGMLFIIKGFAELALYFSGTKTTAYITYATRNLSSRTSRSYTAHYTFTLPDQSLASGSGSVTTTSGTEPMGSIKVAYFPGYPNYNSPYGTGLIFYFLMWSGAGITIVILNIKELNKIRTMEKTSTDISDIDNTYRNYEVNEKKRIGWIVVPAIFIFGVVGYYIYNSLAVEEKGTDSIVTETGEMGNSVGNTANDGMLLEQNGKIFFINWDDNHRLYSMSTNGTDLKKLTEESVSCLNGIDGWIYYTNFNDGDKLYRIREDGSKRSKIYKWKSEYVNVCGEWIYLSNGNDHNKLYKIKINGSREKQLNSDESMNVIVSNGWIYYNNKTDNDALYRIRTDGSERTKLADLGNVNFLVEGDRIYFSYSKDEGKLYSMKIDGTDMRLFSQEKAGFINVDDNYFYYSNVAQDGELYRMKKDGSNPKKLSEINPFTISLSEKYIFFIDFWNEDKLLIGNKDGSEIRKLK